MDFEKIYNEYKNIEKTHMNHFREIKKLCNPNQSSKLEKMDLNKIFLKEKQEQNIQKSKKL